MISPVAALRTPDKGVQLLSSDGIGIRQPARLFSTFSCELSISGCSIRQLFDMSREQLLRKCLAAVLLPFLAALASGQTRISDVIYMKSGGAAFTMDVVKPARPNRAAVIFMVSGGWMSD